MQSIAWYRNRLKQMSVAEIAYRGRQSALNRTQSLGLCTLRDVPTADLSQSPEPWIGEAPGMEVDRHTRAADSVCDGVVRVFALDDHHLGSPPQWNRDPRTGIEAPRKFGKTLDYRDETRVGDIKYLWEPNRHLHLVVLAQAYKLTGQDKYLRALEIQLTSWFQQCPYLLGPNWTSSLELGIRLINWSIVWCLIGGPRTPLFEGPEGVALRDRWLRSVYRHVHFIAGHLSRFSSANNHLIGEAAGMFIATCTWPLWPATKDWRHRARAILTEQCQKQNHADGVNKEQAISYQQFVLDFLLLATLAGRRYEIEFPRPYWDRIEAMCVYLASIMDMGGNVPMIGDADDGYVVRLSQEDDFCPYRSLLATGAVLFERPELKHKAGKLDDKTRWLLGEEGAARFTMLTGSVDDYAPPRRAFPQGGYYILGSDFETPQELKLIVDAGPLGYLSIAAHGHADALAVTLSLGGREFLVDPGTYAYHTDRQWRDYFRGSAAHNTVVVDGENQSRIGGNFMWTRHAAARCIAWTPGADMDEFSGSHDGYQTLPDPVNHRRDIRLDKVRRQIVISDTLECRGSHSIDRCWHFSEHCRVTITNTSIEAENDARRLRLSAGEQDIEVLELRASEQPPGGWVSRRFDVKIPATTVWWRQRIHGTAELTTTLECL